MSCTCTEDKFVSINGEEYPWLDGQDLPGGAVIIGRNRVVCQYCLDNQAALKKNADKQSIVSQLYQLDIKAIRPLMDGDSARITTLNSQKAVLRQQLIDLG